MKFTQYLRGVRKQRVGDYEKRTHTQQSLTRVPHKKWTPPQYPGGFRTAVPKNYVPYDWKAVAGRGLTGPSI